MDSSQKFVRPFEGRPKPLELSSLFLFSPDVFLRLQDLPTARRAFTDINKEGLYKRLERGIRNDKISPDTLDEVISLAPHEGDQTIPNLLRAAYAGDVDSIKRIEDLGQWGAFILAYADNKEVSTIHEKFILQLQKLSASFIRHWQNQRYDEGLALLKEEPCTKQIFSEHDILKVVPAQSLEELAPLRAAAAMEVHLGIMVAMILDGESKSPGQLEALRSMLPSPHNPDVTPIKILASWLLQSSGADSPEELALKLSETGIFSADIDLAVTLNRWIAGTNFPESELFFAVCDALKISKQSYARTRHQFTRHLNFLGHLEERIRNLERSASAEKKHLFYPWPKLLHGFDTYEEWVSTRFESWRNFHLSH